MYMSARLHRKPEYNSRLRGAEEPVRTKSMRLRCIMRCLTQSSLLLPRRFRRQSIPSMQPAASRARIVPARPVRPACRLLCVKQSRTMLLSRRFPRRSVRWMPRTNSVAMRTKSVRTKCSMYHHDRRPELVPMPRRSEWRPDEYWRLPKLRVSHR